MGLSAEFIVYAGDEGLKRPRSQQSPRPLAVLRKPLEFSKVLDTMQAVATSVDAVGHRDCALVE